MAVVTQVRVDGGIVVGDDGSEQAAAALLWAAEEARARRRALHVVRAWSLTGAPRPAGWQPGYVPPLEEYEKACREVLERDVAVAVEQWQDLQVTCHVAHTDPVQALLGAAEHAELLVLGWRGRGALRDRLLGSTAAEVVRRAACSVAVIRPFTP